MNDKELKSMNRIELMELLIELTRENDLLAEEVDDLKEQLRKAKKNANNRNIEIKNAGSIAEAALKLNGVFEAAEQAAAQYLENIERLSGEQQRVCDEMLAETRRKCQEMEAGTQRRCDEIYREAETRATRQWGDLAKHLEDAVHQYVKKPESDRK